MKHVHIIAQMNAYITANFFCNKETSLPWSQERLDEVCLSALHAAIDQHNLQYRQDQIDTQEKAIYFAQEFYHYFMQVLTDRNAIQKGLH